MDEAHLWYDFHKIQQIMWYKPRLSSLLPGPPTRTTTAGTSSFCITTGGKSSRSDNGSDERHAGYKVKLCNNFSNGACSFGARCVFAHGEAELRCRQWTEHRVCSKSCPHRHYTEDPAAAFKALHAMQGSWGGGERGMPGGRRGANSAVKLASFL